MRERKQSAIEISWERRRRRYASGTHPLQLRLRPEERQRFEEAAKAQNFANVQAWIIYTCTAATNPPLPGASSSRRASR